MISDEEIIDGIKYSKWRPQDKRNNRILSKHQIKTNSDYRRFLMTNANSLTRINKGIQENLCCKIENPNNARSSNEPYLFIDDCYDNVPFSYGDSDLKQYYMNNYYVNCSKKIYSTN